MTDPANPTQPSTLLQEIKNKDVCIIWHCRNLRTQDHPAIEFATQNHYSILPIFIFDPEFYEDGNLACYSRVEFMLESISDLKTQYEWSSFASLPLTTPVGVNGAGIPAPD